MSKDKLIKRLSWYYPTERFNVFLFTGVLAYVIIKYSLINTIFLLYGLFIMTFILLQGQHYWKLKLYRLTGKDIDQNKNLGLFRNAKKINQILIGFIPVMLLIQFYIGNWTISNDNLIVWAILANIFAILEHINYYHRQLMIDNISDLNWILRNKKIKIASLKKDLDENKL
jgi:hypothetical protein